jgi:hypothetical protein
MFIAGLSSVDLVGTCQRLKDPHASVWSAVQLANFSTGTSNIHWPAKGQTISELAIVTPYKNQIQMFNGSSGSAQIQIDVLGYFANQ